MTARPLTDAIARGDDDEAVARVLAGDRDAFRALVERYEIPVLRLVRNLGPRSGAHEDLAQEVFVAAFAALASFDPRRGKFRSWLFVIARNRAINARKGAKAPSYADPEAIADARTPDDDLGYAELRRTLDAALDALPDDQRAAFVLEEIVGLTSADAAEIEGVAVGTIRSRLSRAKASLRASISPFLGEDT